MLYRPVVSNQPMVDLVDSYDRAYNFTTCKSHDVKLKALVEYLEDLM
eukprot:gene10578-3097_t